MNFLVVSNGQFKFFTLRLLPTDKSLLNKIHHIQIFFIMQWTRTTSIKILLGELVSYPILFVG